MPKEEKKKKRGGGRPPSITARQLEQLCEALEEAMPLSYASDLVGLPRQTVYDTYKRDPNFRAKIEIAKAVAIRGLVKLTAKQQGGWKLLKNLGREEFKETMEHELTGKDGSPLTLVIKDFRNEDDK